MIRNRRCRIAICSAVLALAMPMSAAVGARRHAVGVWAQSDAGTVTLLANLSSAGSDKRETTFGDVVADAVRATAGVDAAIVPADELQGLQLPAGRTPIRSVLAGLHYADDPTDTVVVLELTGDELMQAVNRSVSRQPLPFGGFLQVSGLRIVYDPKLPEKHRVTSLQFGSALVEPARTYRVATVHNLAIGSFGYFRFWEDSDVKNNTGIGIRQALADYLAAHNPLNVLTEGRITSP